LFDVARYAQTFDVDVMSRDNDERRVDNVRWQRVTRFRAIEDKDAPRLRAR